MRLLVLSVYLACVAPLMAEESPYRLFKWDRGIGIHPVGHPEMKVYLWFYEWNMFGAVHPAQHSRGDWENDVSVARDGKSANIECAPHFKIEVSVSESGADLVLSAKNHSGREWPELAGIIACFNPGPERERNAQFENENTLFRAPDGLLKLNKREIHWNDNLRKKIDAQAVEGTYAWTSKWPTAEPNATGGLLMRESNDGRWRTGIAWERFLSCQGHNPWKCMHLGIHLGPLKAGESRKVKGKIYLTEEAADQLLDRYEHDFPRPDQLSNARGPKDADDLKSWLKNMVAHHRFSVEEVRAATALSNSEIESAVDELGIEHFEPRGKNSQYPLRVLPYPGGRHPRIGFLEGAVRPQRETKLSVFTPWDPKSYIVADVPEAIWWNGEGGGRELLYLAHTHVPTLWSRQGIELEKQEWVLEDGGSYLMQRKLPNGIEFGTRARAVGKEVLMEQWITNGTDKILTGLRVQNCVMLKGAPEFARQVNDNKLFRDPYSTCRDSSGSRWVITAWERCVRPWGNARCPCLHSDPQFPDCPPGETVRIRGWLSFFEGEDIEAELDRIEATGWRK